MSHVAQAIVKAGEKRGETLGDNLLDEMRRAQQKAWELLARTESQGDHRGAIVALREVRECLKSLGAMLANAQTPNDAGAEALVARLQAGRNRMVVRFVGPGDKPERDEP